MIQRAVRAAMLDRKVYRQLTFDGEATADAVLVVAGVGVILFLVDAVRAGASLGSYVTGILSAAIFTCASWLFTAAATWLIGTKLFQGSGSMEQVIRLHGFAYVPLLLNVLGLALAALAATIWHLAALLVATREALDQDNRRAAVTVLLGFALVALVSLALNVPFVAVQGLLAR